MRKNGFLRYYGLKGRLKLSETHSMFYTLPFVNAGVYDGKDSTFFLFLTFRIRSRARKYCILYMLLLLIFYIKIICFFFLFCLIFFSDFSSGYIPYMYVQRIKDIDRYYIFQCRWRIIFVILYHILQICIWRWYDIPSINNDITQFYQK